MAHYRKPLAAAVALNSAIFLVEAFAGFQANSLSLIMDSVHNLSDELALVFLYLAFVLPLGLSRNLLRSANVFNSIGIVVLSALLLWQATVRFLNPAPVWGGVTIVIGLLAALSNWGVARLLRKPRPQQSCNSLGLHSQSWRHPGFARAGAVRPSSNRHRVFFFDPLIAGAVALWLMVSTLRQVMSSHNELISPEKLGCGHEGDA